jgi:hypothetical protein
MWRLTTPLVNIGSKIQTLALSSRSLYPDIISVNHRWEHYLICLLCCAERRRPGYEVVANFYATRGGCSKGLIGPLGSGGSTIWHTHLNLRFKLNANHTACLLMSSITIIFHIFTRWTIWPCVFKMSWLQTRYCKANGTYVYIKYMPPASILIHKDLHSKYWTSSTG